MGLLGVCVTEDQVSVLIMTRPGFANYCVAQQKEEDVPGAELVPDALQYLKQSFLQDLLRTLQGILSTS